MNTTINLIQPAEVKRDSEGNWYHPDLPTFYGTDEATPDSPKWYDWMREQGMFGQCICSLEDEDESHPVYQSYFENGSADFSAWDPEPPEGDGWFLLSIGDTEDGPCAWFVRRASTPKDAK